VCETIHLNNGLLKASKEETGKLKIGKWLTSELSQRVHGRRTTVASEGSSGRKKCFEFVSFV
jgi:hypothetical protein